MATIHGLKKMLFTGRTRHCYVYDPDLGDWYGRFAKPKGMSYNSCFYTLTVCPTPLGLMCWTEQGQVFQFDADKKEWIEKPLKGDKLPGSVVDNSTVVHDSQARSSALRPQGLRRQGEVRRRRSMLST